MIQTLNEVLLFESARRALRNWLLDLGRDSAMLREQTAGIYFLGDMQRLVQAKAAIAPHHPASLSRAEEEALRDLAKRLEAEAWEARIILRANYHPQAILWRRLD
jgi:hypothetical protein